MQEQSDVSIDQFKNMVMETWYKDIFDKKHSLKKFVTYYFCSISYCSRIQVFEFVFICCYETETILHAIKTLSVVYAIHIVAGHILH